MNKSRRPRKRAYTPPRLRCYGDLRKLTGGGVQTHTEANAVTTAKTRPKPTP